MAPLHSSIIKSCYSYLSKGHTMCHCALPPLLCSHDLECACCLPSPQSIFTSFPSPSTNLTHLKSPGEQTLLPEVAPLTLGLGSCPMSCIPKAPILLQPSGSLLLPIYYVSPAGHQLPESNMALLKLNSAAAPTVDSRAKNAC